MSETGRRNRPVREIDGYHGEHRRHARDAHASPDAPAGRPSDARRGPSGMTAYDLLKLSTALGPEGQKKHRDDYQQRVSAAYADYAARHAKPGAAEPEPGRMPPETRDKPTNRIADRDLPESKEVARKRKPERSWLPSNEVSQVAVSLDALFTTINASYNIIPGKVDGIFAAALGVVVAGVAWANKRWKDKHHGDRPEG